VIELDGPDPLWRQVAEDLERRIRAGEWTRRMPSMRIFADEYGVSHATISDALRVLAEKGLVITTKGRGSFVRKPHDRPRDVEDAEG